MRCSLFLFAALLSLTTTFVPAQTPAASPDAYVLGGGDQISIHVADLSEIPETPLRLDPNGGVDLPLIGKVQAGGLTLAQLRSQLTTRFSKYITDPHVSVNLVENNNETVSVLGEVTSPGVHGLSGTRRVLEILSIAGGLKPDAGPRLIITRSIQRGPVPLAGTVRDESGQFTTATLSIDTLLAGTHPADNIIVQPGDVITVPKGDIVYVVGDVKRAGGFPLSSHESISLLQAVSLAEGLGQDAASTHARILRPVAGQQQPKEIPVDVRKIFEGKAPDVPLFANDILFIPNSAAKSGARRATEAIVQIATGAAIFAR